MSLVTRALCASLLFASVSASAAVDVPALKAAIDNPARATEQRARDPYRHPLQTLEFFGIAPNMTVVEIWPGLTGYTDILAAYLHDNGHYIAATPAASLPTASDYTRNGVAAYDAKLKADPKAFDKVTVSEFAPPLRTDIAPAGSADVVLTFRNVHNWIGGDFEQQAFEAFYKALKPGGVLGVVEHRAKPGSTLEQMKDSGYVNEDYVISLAKNAGFTLAAQSAINGNSKDTKPTVQNISLMMTTSSKRGNG